MIPPRDFSAEEAKRQYEKIDFEWTDICLAVYSSRWGNGDWNGWIQMGRPESVI